MNTCDPLFELQNILVRILDRCLGRRPYRRVSVGSFSPLLRIPALDIEVTRVPGDCGDEAALLHWQCRITITARGDQDRHGIETALEVIDLLHGGDLESEDAEVVVIDIAFTGASRVHPSSQEDRTIVLDFAITTVENDDIGVGLMAPSGPAVTLG